MPIISKHPNDYTTWSLVSQVYNQFAEEGETSITLHEGVDKQTGKKFPVKGPSQGNPNAVPGSDYTLMLIQKNKNHSKSKKNTLKPMKKQILFLRLH